MEGRAAHQRQGRYRRPRRPDRPAGAGDARRVMGHRWERNFKGRLRSRSLNEREAGMNKPKAQAGLRKAKLLALAGATVTVAAGAPAWAYIGDSFILIPGKSGEYQGAEHKGWIRAEAND